MRVNYAVTFEFDLRPPLTHRGTVEGWAASTCTRRAVDEAQKALQPVNWSSMVVVLLERLPDSIADKTPTDVALQDT
jgi:hypothetical protein